MDKKIELRNIVLKQFKEWSGLGDREFKEWQKQVSLEKQATELGMYLLMMGEEEEEEEEGSDYQEEEGLSY